MYYYLYKITNKINNKQYIGVHRTKNLDDGYMGSGIVIKNAIKKHGKENFEKEILEFFSSQKEMYEKEYEVIDDEFVKRTDTYNIRTGGYGYRSEEVKDTIVIEDKDGNRFRVSTKDERYISGEFKPILKGKVIVKDEDGNIFCTTSDDPDYISGKLVGHSKGYKHSKESRDIMSKKRTGEKNHAFGKKWINNGIEKKYVPSEEVGLWLDKGWKLGLALTKKMWINKEGKLKFVEEYDIEKWLEMGWNIGYKKY